MSIQQTNLFNPCTLLLLLCVTVPATAAEYAAEQRASTQRHQQEVNDLAYGSSLYHFFQDKKLAAITDLTVAKEKAALKNSPVDAELLLANLYFDYGLTGEAEAIFTRLLDGDTSIADKNKVWFNLARLQYDNNHYQQAKTLLARIDAELLPQREAERQHIQTNLFIQDKEFERAVKAAASIAPENIWRAYSEYNLGIALTNRSDTRDGAAWLKAVSQGDSRDEEWLSLKDSARLVLALSSLKQNRLDQAISYFGDIRVTGPLSNKALLGTGWAWSRKSDPKKALTYWQALTDKNQVDDASLEAHLATAYAFEQLDNKALSAQYYDRAAERYEQLLQVMDLHIDSIKRMELIKTLSQSGLAKSGIESAPGQNIPDYRANAILLHMIVSDSFQQALHHYRELNEIHHSLVLWKNNLPVLELMLAERRAAFINKQPIVDQASDFDQLNHLRARRDRLAEKVYTIKETDERLEITDALTAWTTNFSAPAAQQKKSSQTSGMKPAPSAKTDSVKIPRGFLALATEEESDDLQLLDEVDALLSRLKNKQELTEAQRKYDLLYGMLYWDIVTEYPQRYWRIQHQLQSLDRALKQAESAARSLTQAANKNQQKLNDFAGRIKGQDKEIQRLEIIVTQLIKQQEDKINQLAIQAIESRKRKLEAFRLSARYSLARLYDEISRQRAVP